MQTTPSNVTIFEALRQVREQLSESLRLQAGEIARLEQSLELMREQHREAEEAARRLLEAMERTLAEAGNAISPSLQGAWGSVRNLIETTHAEQVFEVLAAEAAWMNVRAVVFEVRGKAAWASFGGGFELSNQELHSLVVPLNQENAFRQVFETGQALESGAEALAKNRNVLDKLQPAPNACIWLIPVRSADSVTALLYAECGEGENAARADALKLLAEFAGAHLDRLTAMSGGFAGLEPRLREEPAEAPEAAAKEAQETETLGPEVPAVSAEVAAAEPGAEAAADPTAEEAEISAAPVPPETQEAPAPEAVAAAPAGPPSEADQRVHRDAQRFSRLLVSEIDLYNKEKVQEGRKNKDLYGRLKKDIDRSRQTYEKRFGNTVVKHVDYFHEELVRALAENDPSLLGSDYPGPSV